MATEADTGQPRSLKFLYWCPTLAVGIVLAFLLWAKEWNWWSQFGQVVETAVLVVVVPGALWQLWLQLKATEDQASATLLQTIATIISWVQAEEIRQSQRLLYDLEESDKISTLSADKWKPEWKQAADRVSQSFNSAAIIAEQHPKIQDIWIRPARRTILTSWKIAQPRIEERRKQESDLSLWKEFEWLAGKARGCEAHSVVPKEGT